MPRVVRIVRGERFPPNTKAVDRRSRWGNPFVVGKDGDAYECVRRYAAYLQGNGDLLDRLTDLTGFNLGCWDMEWHGMGRIPLDCHAPMLLRVANSPELLARPRAYLQRVARTYECRVCKVRILGYQTFDLHRLMRHSVPEITQAR